MINNFRMNNNKKNLIMCYNKWKLTDRKNRKYND